MDVGFFDVNARGNTSSIMATTAVVNFYILRATSPIPRNLILQLVPCPANLGAVLTVNSHCVVTDSEETRSSRTVKKVG
jgi:hypothetical protein